MRALLAIAVLSAATASAGDWSYMETVDEMTDKKSQTLAALSESGEQGLILSCIEGSLTVSALWSNHVSAHAKVFQRVGSAPAEIVPWSVSEDRKNLMHPARGQDAARMARQWAAADRLLLRIDDTTAAFAMDDLAAKLPRLPCASR